MLPASVRILLCTEPQDMRRSFDRLAEVVRTVMGEEPQSGALFVFVGKRATRVKVLWWDASGYCMLYKRMHEAIVQLPTSDGASVQVDARALTKLLAGEPRRVVDKVA